jgi:hypothetical protein
VTHKQLIRKYRTLKKRRMALSEQMQQIQLRECLHPNLVRTPKSNTGNYDPSSDCYWYENKCPDCERFWMEDQ